MTLSTTDLRSVRTIVTHANCPDGIASAMILSHALPDAYVAFVQYGTPEHERMLAEPGMLFCDITPPRERAMEFAEAGAIVLDHHKGARDIVEVFGERGVYADEQADPGVSGAMLAFSEVYRPLFGLHEQVADFATLAGIRDTWQTKHSRWKEACEQAEALKFFGFQGPLGRAWLSEQEEYVGTLLFEKKLAAARSIAETGLYKLGNWRLFNDGGGRTSDVAEVVRELEPQVDGVVGFHYAVTSDGKMNLVFSMRSGRDGVDVAAIAKANGGGGHTRAAGFSVDALLGGWSHPPDTCFEIALLAI